MTNTGSIIVIFTMVGIAALLFWLYKTGRLGNLFGQPPGDLLAFNKLSGYTGPVATTTKGGYVPGQPLCLQGDTACYNRTKAAFASI